jgi:hypothetical protein
MDTPELNLSRQTAGSHYLDALRRLGLEPVALFWAYDTVVKSFVLVLITEFFDYKGPYEISKLLFQAYNAAATPREIDPFIIRLHSPAQSAIKNLRIPTHLHAIDQKTGRPTGEAAEIKTYTLGDLIVSGQWVYKFGRAPKKKSTIDLSRKWSRFERNVTQLAA